MEPIPFPELLQQDEPILQNDKADAQAHVCTCVWSVLTYGYMQSDHLKSMIFDTVSLKVSFKGKGKASQGFVAVLRHKK